MLEYLCPVAVCAESLSTGSAWAVFGVGSYTLFGLCHLHHLQAMWIWLEQNSLEVIENYFTQIWKIFWDCFHLSMKKNALVRSS